MRSFSATALSRQWINEVSARLVSRFHGVRHISRASPTQHTLEPSVDPVSIPPVIPARSVIKQESRRRASLKSAEPFSSFLTDTFNRQHDYLRVSITERCNLRCLYCMPEEGVPLSPKKHLLTVPEILYLSALFVAQGVNKIRLTGGEPTVHPQILPLLKELGALQSQGLRELALTTNGLTLARKLDAMVDAGVTGINLSLDTLDPFQFEIMTRRRGFDQVMKSISKILEMKRAGARLKLKVNAVVIRGLNDAQIVPFVEMTRNQDLEVRFIEYMPFGGNRWSSTKMLTYQEMLAVIREKFPDLAKIQDHPNDTSKTFQVPGFVGKIGFITSMTDHFCGTCNRLRITSDGNLKVCLFGNAEVSLRDMLRDRFNGGEPIDEAAYEAMKQIEMDRHEGRTEGTLGMQEKESELLELIGMAVKRKKEKHAGIGELEHMKNRPMILIDHPCKGILPTISDHNSIHILNHTPWQRIPRSLLSQNILNNSISSRAFSTSATCQSARDTPPSHQSTEPTSTAPKQDNEHKDTDRLTHLTSSGTAHMVSLPPPTTPSNTSSTSSTSSSQTKPLTTRRAIARTLLTFSNPTLARLISTSLLKKGDVLSVSRIAGIMAAKRTADLVPLCHNIALSGVEVDVVLVVPGSAEPGFSSGDHHAQGGDGSGSADIGTKDYTVPSPYAEAGLSPHGNIVVTAHVHCFGQTGVEMEALTAATVAGLTAYDMCKAVDKGMRMEAVRVILKEGGRSGRWVEGVDRQGGNGSR